MAATVHRTKATRTTDCCIDITCTVCQITDYRAPGSPTCLQVEQFDTHSAATTVREALIFSGVLRNEKDVDMKTTLEFVDQVSTAIFHCCSPACMQMGIAWQGRALCRGCSCSSRTFARSTSMQQCIVFAWPSFLCCCWVVVMLLLGGCDADHRFFCVGDGLGGAADPVRGSCGEPWTVWTQCGAAQAPDHCCGTGEPCPSKPQMLQTRPCPVCVPLETGLKGNDLFLLLFLAIAATLQVLHACLLVQAAVTSHEATAACKLLLFVLVLHMRCCRPSSDSPSCWTLLHAVAAA